MLILITTLIRTIQNLLPFRCAIIRKQNFVYIFIDQELYDYITSLGSHEMHSNIKLFYDKNAKGRHNSCYIVNPGFTYKDTSQRDRAK